VTCGVWIGYDNRQSLGDKETGGKAALPIWMDFMKAAISGKSDEAFPADMQRLGATGMRGRQVAAAVKPEPKPPLRTGSSGQPAQP
jgi:penicillin-binding protein 1A